MGAERNIVYKLRTYEKIYQIKGIKLALLRVIIFKGIYDFGNAHACILFIFTKLQKMCLLDVLINKKMCSHLIYTT